MRTADSNPNDPLSMLMAFNLTRQEASVYVGLMTEGEMNGYEAAKSLGISRSNAYTALAGLVEKGAAWTIEEGATRYTAVPPMEFCSNRLNHLSQIRDRLRDNLPKRRIKPGSYITIRGRAQILDRLRNLLNDTRKRVYLALAGPLLRPYLGELNGILSKGGKVVIITDSTTARALRTKKALPGAVIHEGTVHRNQIRAIVDSHFVLTGELTKGTHASCLFSDQKNLADLFKASLRNEIRLIELGASPEE